MENNNNQPKKPEGNEKRPKGNLWVTLIITVAVVLIGSLLFNFIKKSQYRSISRWPYSCKR